MSPSPQAPRDWPHVSPRALAQTSQQLQPSRTVPSGHWVGAVLHRDGSQVPHSDGAAASGIAEHSVEKIARHTSAT